MLIKLNANNTTDILLFLSYKDVINVFLSSKYMKGLVAGSAVLWEALYFGFLFEKYCGILPEERHHTLIHHYLCTNYSPRILHEMIFDDYRNSILRRDVGVSRLDEWKHRAQEVMRIGKKLCQPFVHTPYDFVHKVVVSGNYPNRCGHASSVVTDSLTGDSILVQLCGATDEYQMLNRSALINLTKKTVMIDSSLTSLISPQWFCNSVVKDNCIYFLNGEDANVIKLSSISTSQKPPVLVQRFRQINPLENMLYLNGSSLILDSRPSKPEASLFSFRLIVFGGRNDFSREVFNKTMVGYVVETSQGGAVEWKEHTVSGDIPPPRYNHATQLIGRNMYLFGGWTNLLYAPPSNYINKLQVRNAIFYNDLYSLNIDTMHWTKIETFGIPLSPRCQVSMLFMPKRDRTGREYSHYLVIASGANHDIRVSKPLFY